MRRILVGAMAIGLLVFGYLAGSAHVLRQPSLAAADDCQTFPQTGFRACGDFLAYWNAHGGLAQQGYPISPTFQEKSETDGKTYTVQYFERAVFEAHPENQPPNNVLLSLLGSQKYKTKYPNGAVASNATTPTSAPVAVAPTATASPVAVSAGPTDLNAYAQYLQTKFGSYGSHKIGLEKVAASSLGNGYAVSFEVAPTEASYLIQSASKSDLRTWGIGLLAELKAHWPNQYVAGTLTRSRYTFSPGTKSACHYVDYDNPDADLGFYVADDFVSASYLPPSTVGSGSTDSITCIS